MSLTEHADSLITEQAYSPVTTCQINNSIQQHQNASENRLTIMANEGTLEAARMMTNSVDFGGFGQPMGPGVDDVWTGVAFPIYPWLTEWT